MTRWGAQGQGPSQCLRRCPCLPLPAEEHSPPGLAVQDTGQDMWPPEPERHQAQNPARKLCSPHGRLLPGSGTAHGDAVCVPGEGVGPRHETPAGWDHAAGLQRGDLVLPENQAGQETGGLPGCVEGPGPPGTELAGRPRPPRGSWTRVQHCQQSPGRDWASVPQGCEAGAGASTRRRVSSAPQEWSREQLRACHFSWTGNRREGSLAKNQLCPSSYSS